MTWKWEWVREAPVTQLRIFMAELMAGATTAVYLAKAMAGSTWHPDGDWLLFLLGYAGLGGAQWFGKRKTEWKTRRGGSRADKTGGGITP